MSQTTNCDRSRLKLLLAESLSNAEEESVSNHIASCSECRRELESLAADESWWNEANHRLTQLVDRYGILQDLSSSSHDNSSFHDDAVEHFAADFAVDFLEPSQTEGSLGRLGDYEIEEVIGRGGMGIVLRGFQKELHRHVAVKVLVPHLATSGAARRRFAREAQATAAVVHQHVMAIHSVNPNAKLPYLVMPYISCQSLQDRVDQQGPLDVKDILRIGMQAALGLAAAHAQGLVHRDVKPANILLETNVDRVLLTDFGLARAVDDATLTRTGIIAGTPQYMSPEQANGDLIDHRSDLFSLGSVLYAMSTGRPPFRSDTTFGVLRRIRETAPRSIREINAEIPEWLENLVMTLLSKSPADRITTATDVATLLEKCLAHVQQPTAIELPESPFLTRQVEKANSDSGESPSSLDTDRTIEAEQSKSDREVASRKLWRHSIVTTAVLMMTTVIIAPVMVKLTAVPFVGKKNDGQSASVQTIVSSIDTTDRTLPETKTDDEVSNELSRLLEWNSTQSALIELDNELESAEFDDSHNNQSLPSTG